MGPGASTRGPPRRSSPASASLSLEEPIDGLWCNARAVGFRCARFGQSLPAEARLGQPDRVHRSRPHDRRERDPGARRSDPAAHQPRARSDVRSRGARGADVRRGGDPNPVSGPSEERRTAPVREKAAHECYFPLASSPSAHIPVEDRLLSKDDALRKGTGGIAGTWSSLRDLSRNMSRTPQI